LSDSPTELQRTVLHDRHVELGARMVPFSGWRMPVQYTGIKKEHAIVRETAGLFDVSHMGECGLRGPRAAEAVQRLVTNDVGKLAPGKALYTVMCYDSGGIVDDCIVYQRADNDYLIVLNAGNIAKDLAWIREHASPLCDVVDESNDTALIAAQGPRAVALVDGLADVDLAATPRFSFATASVGGIACMAARTGYTGEDGFELACKPDDAVPLWNALLDAGAAPCGLGARDTLRLEARLSLYGNDIDETTTPYEAGLGWVVKPDAGDFIGKEALVAQKAAGVPRKLVGFVVEGRGIPRHGYPIVDRSLAENQQQIGTVTSGTTGITVGKSIGLGYVPADRAKVDTAITIDCRGKDVEARIVKGAFYKSV